MGEVVTICLDKDPEVGIYNIKLVITGGNMVPSSQHGRTGVTRMRTVKKQVLAA